MRRRAAISAGAFAAFAVATAVLAGCSAGQITQTSSQVAAVPGAFANIGPDGIVAIRNALIPYNGLDGYPAGGNAPLTVRIFNNGPAVVTLVKVASVDAESVTLEGGKPAPTSAPPASPSPTGAPASGSPSGSPSGSASASATATATAAAPAHGPSTFSIAVPALGYSLLVPGQGEYLQLTGLKRALTPGTTVSVVFTFADGSSATLSLPVGPATAAVPRATPVVTGGSSE